MFETARYEAGRRLRGTATLAGGIAVLVVFFVWYFSVLDVEELTGAMESLPPAMLDAFGIQTIATIEGFLAAEVYNFVWVLGLGLYFAYAAGGLIAGDVERDRMDLLLSFPVSRSRLLAEKFSALVLPIVAVNIVTAAVVYGGVAAIGESIDLGHLVVVHVLSIPYLLACAAIGTLFSVVFDRADTAKRGAVGLVFALFLVKSVTAGADGYEWIQYVTPMHYYQPTPILIDGTYQLADAGVLLAVFIVLLAVSHVIFQRRDV